MVSTRAVKIYNHMVFKYVHSCYIFGPVFIDNDVCLCVTDERHEPWEREPVYRTLHRRTAHFYRYGLLHP